MDCDISSPVKTLHCNVTAAYIRECKRQGIEMSLPDECCKFDNIDSYDKCNSDCVLEGDLKIIVR